MLLSKKMYHFICVAEAESINQAAEKICITPSAVRHSIKELEAQLGSRLFIKTAKKTRLTGVGKLLFNEIMPVYQQARMLLDKVTHYSRGGYQIKIQTDGLYYPELTESIQTFINSADRIQFTEDNPHPINQLLNHECDIAVSSCILPHRDIPEGICRHNLGEENMVILAHQSVIETYRTLSLQIPEGPFLQTAAFSVHPVYEVLKKKLKAAGTDPTFNFLHDFTDICSTLSHGVGISLMPESFACHPLLSVCQLRTTALPKALAIRISRDIYTTRGWCSEILNTWPDLLRQEMNSTEAVYS